MGVQIKFPATGDYKTQIFDNNTAWQSVMQLFTSLDNPLTVTIKTVRGN